jgi:hypothetical protein
MFGIPLQTFLGLSVVATVLSAVGNLVALFLKEVVIARSFETWKARKTLEDVYRRYQLPIFITAQELSNRLYHLSRDDNPLRDERDASLALIRNRTAREGHSATDKHYFRYRFLSNVYRLCSFLGWLELYRRDVGTLDTNALDKNHKLEDCLHFVRSALADGSINEHRDWQNWRDYLIFREELRAIGHRMISDDAGLCVMDFGTFVALLESDPDGDGDARWFIQAAHFFEELKDNRDFRIVRMKMLVAHLIDVMELLQPGRANRDYVATAGKIRASLDDFAGGKKWSELS